MRLIKRLSIGLLGLLVLLYAVIWVWPEEAYKPYEVSDEYKARIEAYNLPDMPSGWTYKTFTVRDGTKLRWGEGPVNPEAKATVVLIPGYTGSIRMYGDHVTQLSARGYHVITYDIRGQGGSQRYRSEHPENLYVKDFSVYGDDLAEFMDHISVDRPGPKIIAAISFGGAVAVRASGDYPDTADGLMLLAPAYVPNTAPYSISQMKILASIVKFFGKSKHFAPGVGPWVPDSLTLSGVSDCGSHQERLYLRDAVYTKFPEERVGGPTTNWISEIIENGEIVRAPDFISKIDIPVTTIAAENDTIVDGAVVEEVCRSGFPDCKLVVPPGSGHCLTLENDKILATIWDETDALLARITG